MRRKSVMDERLASLVLLLAVCFGAFQEALPAVCHNAPVPVLVNFQQGAEYALVECSRLPDYKWWRSNSSCELSSFTPYRDCTTQNCQIPLETLMNDFYMYFCCTRNVSSLEGIQFQSCTQIQVCPKIIDFVVPSVVFVGSQEKVYVTIQANPPVQSPHFTIELNQQNRDNREIEFFTVKEGTVLNFTYVYIFEVPSDILLEDEPTFEVSVFVQFSNCDFDFQSKTIHKILNDSLPSICPTSSASSLPVSTTSDVGLFTPPTPSPTDVGPPCENCSVAVLGPVVPLVVIIFLLIMGIVGTVCVVCVMLKCRKSSGCTKVTSSDEEESSRSRPNHLAMIGNGLSVHGHGRRHHEYATISNASTPHTPNTHPRWQLNRPASVSTTSSTTTTPMGVNNEAHQLMSPPLPPRNDGTYSHEGDDMVLPNPESESTRGHELYSHEGNRMFLPTSNSEPTAV